MSTWLTDKQIIDAVDAAVAEKGADYTYERGEPMDPDEAAPSCLYVHGDKPGCIVGNAMHRLGIDLATLRESEGRSAGGLLIDLRDKQGYHASMWAQDFLDAVQHQQDNGDSWGDAVAEGRIRADRAHKFRGVE